MNPIEAESKKTCMGPYAGVLSSTITSLVQCQLQHMYQGQTYARVALNPMPESTLYPPSGTWDLASASHFFYTEPVFVKV